MRVLLRGWRAVWELQDRCQPHPSGWGYCSRFRVGLLARDASGNDEGLDAFELGTGEGELFFTAEAGHGADEVFLGPVVAVEVARVDQAEHQLDLLDLVEVLVVLEEQLVR